MESILQRIVQRGHYRFADHADSWQQAIAMSTAPLVRDGCVDADYYRQIVDCVETYGPYIVFDHEVAMPHSQENAEGVHETCIGFLRLRDAVSFGVDEDGEEKKARLFFTLAACDPEVHLENIRQLAGLFCNTDLLDALMAAQTPEDILAADRAFPTEPF